MDDIVGATPHANYAISPDGKTFAMVRRAPANRIIVLQNLPEPCDGFGTLRGKKKGPTYCTTTRPVICDG